MRASNTTHKLQHCFFSVAALHNTQHPTTQHIQRNCSYYSKNLILLLYIQWNIHSIEHTSNISFTLTTVPYTRSGAAACVVVHIIVQHKTLHHTTVSKYSNLCIHNVYVEQIGKRGISFSGSQYGSCSTIYNTLPVTKVVYN